MTPSEISQHRSRLEELLPRLRAEVARMADEALRGTGGEASGGLSDVPVHPADLGSHEYEEEVTLDLLGQKRQLLAEVEAAWERLEQGTFGRCERCHRPIPADRLEVVPYVRHCLACAEKLAAAKG